MSSGYKTRRYPAWEDLPQGLLTTIATFLRLLDPIAFLSFRLVCKSWFSSSFSIFPPFPLKTSPLPSSLTNALVPSLQGHPVLSVTTVCSLCPPTQHDDPSFSSSSSSSSSMSRTNWVLFLDQYTPGKVSIRKPFAGNSYLLPFNFPPSIDLLGYHARGMYRFYSLSRLSFDETKPLLWHGIVLKVVCLRNGDGLVVIALSDEGKLGLLRLELGDSENVGGNSKWEILHDGKGYRFDDIVQFRGDLLGIDRRGRVYEIDIELACIKVIVPRIEGGGVRRKRLVESLGRLYLVVRNNVLQDSDPVFKVYKLNVNAKKWVQVHGLHDQTFFIGHEFSFSVSTEEFYGSNAKNCIFYKNKSFENYNGNDPYGANFEYEHFRIWRSNELDVAVWNMENAAHFGLTKRHSEYLNVFWPPPYSIWRIGVIERLRLFSTAMDQMKFNFEELSQLHQRNELVLERLCYLIERLNNEQIDVLIKSNEYLLKILKKCAEENQVGTSNLVSEERRVSLSVINKTLIERGFGLTDIDWYKLETHLHTCVIGLEEKFSEIEDILKKQRNI